MLSRFTKLVMFLVLILSTISLSGMNVDAASHKVMWGKTELKYGQLGKVTILQDIDLQKIESNGNLSKVRTLKKGEEYRVYYTHRNNAGGLLYGLGNQNFIQNDTTKIIYETPSKSKLALLEKQGLNPPKESVKTPAKPKTPSVPESKEFGSLKGTITWQYNKFIGTKPDVGASIILFPTNMKKVTTTQVIAVEDGKIEASSIGIYYAKVDGFGSYEITDLPAGNYFALYQSSKTFRNYLEPVDSDVYKKLKQYVSDYNEGDFGISAFNHMAIDLVIKNKEVKTISKDWGYSY